MFDRIAGWFQPKKPEPETTRKSFSNFDLISLFSQSTNFLGGLFTGDTATKEKTDINNNAMLVYDACNDPVIRSLIEVGKNQLFSKGWYFKGGKNLANKYSDILRALDFDQVLLDIYYSLYGAGGGSALIYYTKIDSQYKLKIEPRYCEGRVRYNVVADTNNRKIIGYRLYSVQGNCILEIPAEKAYQITFANPQNDYRWGSSPVVSCLPFYKLKRSALFAMQTTYDRGLTGNTVISPDFTAIEKMTEEQRGALSTSMEKLKNLMENQSGLGGRNSVRTSVFPLKVTELGRTSTEMQGLEFVQHCNKEMAAAYITPLSNLGFTESVNYATAQQNRDNITELAIEPLKRQVRLFVEKWLLPQILQNYNSQNSPFVLCQEPTDEDLKLLELKLKTKEKHVSMLAVLNKAGAGLEVNEEFLEDLPFRKILTQESNNTSGQEDLQVFETEQSRAITDELTAINKTPTEIWLEKQKVKAVAKKLETAFVKQYETN